MSTRFQAKYGKYQFTNIVLIPLSLGGKWCQSVAVRKKVQQN